LTSAFTVFLLAVAGTPRFYDRRVARWREIDQSTPQLDEALGARELRVEAA
jgi:hypothetical protein